MDRFRYFLDYGSGYVEVNPLKNDLEWSNVNEITPAINRIKTTGTVIFAGSEYDDIITFKDAGNNYIDFKIEQYSNISLTWNIVFEGNADVRGEWDSNEKIISFKEFNNSVDYYDNLTSNYTIKYGLRTLSLTSYPIVTPSTSSITFDAVLVAGTGLSPANYILTYDINGFNYSPTADPRWAYFLFRSTNGDGSHNFETMTFGYPVTGFTEIKMVIGTTFYGAKWAKLPPAVSATQSATTTVSTVSYRFPDIIGALLTIANSSLTFTEATAVTYVGQSDGGGQYSFFDYTLYQFSEASEIAGLGSKDSEISLKEVLDIMQDGFNLFWYLDGVALKFKHATELSTSGTLDLTSETVYLKALEYIEPSVPDAESWTTNDAEGVALDIPNTTPFGVLQIYYRAVNAILTSITKKVYQIKISTNVVAMLAGRASTDKNQFSLIETTDDTSFPRVVLATGQSFNLRLSPLNLYGHLNKWRYGDDATQASRLKIGISSIIDTEARPLTKLPTIDYNIDLLTDYNMLALVSTSSGDGKTKKVSQKLDSDTLQIDIEI